MAIAMTYQSGPRRNDLRTVLVENVERQVLILPTGRMDVVEAKLLHGTACRHEFWAERLGTDPDNDTFMIPADAVRQEREMGVAVKARHK